jgi:formamidopyrimidine-DNA glycosylase
VPELPEVEALRRSLVDRLLGRTVTAVHVARRDVIAGPSDDSALLVGRPIAELRRHGKQLALIGQPHRSPYGPAVCIHLGMSGSVTHTTAPTRPPRPHTHVTWTLDDGSQLRFADARRFGGLWTFPDRPTLERDRWARLGPDALRITPRKLARGLSGTSRALKAALLDQTLLAGLGNIYVDELLFRQRLHPLTPAPVVGGDPARVRRLVHTMRRLLRTAADRGGSSLRDYINGQGLAGQYQRAHRVYGRAGLPCTRCRAPLAADLVAGRTTVWCPSCQLLAGRRSVRIEIDQ